MESVGGCRKALENVDEGRCCWPSALIQVPDHPWPPALIPVPDQSWLSALIPVPDQPCWEAPLLVLSKELGVLPVRETSLPPGVQHTTARCCCMRGGLASSAWHIDQMGQPPRLGCLGMCTGPCAVVAVSSKCWRSMLALDMSACVCVWGGVG